MLCGFDDRSSNAKLRGLPYPDDGYISVMVTFLGMLNQQRKILELKTILTGLPVTLCAFLGGALPALAQSAALPSSSQAAKPNCQETIPHQFTQLMNGLVEVSRWTSDPTAGMNAVVANLGPQFTTQLTAKPWPEISDRAKLAHVPVIMYHDILPQKQVFFDVTPTEFEEHLKLIQKQGLTPISLDQLVNHLQTGMPLPAKPILLTFDDGYSGHYQYVFPLLKKYGYPGMFSIYTQKIGQTAGRPGVTWAQVKEMAKDPLITIVAHSVNHPSDLRELPDDQLRTEIFESKRILETELGNPIHYFTYPTGFYDERVTKLVTEAGYKAALTMDDLNEGFAKDSNDLLTIKRFGQSRIREVIAQASGGPRLAKWSSGFDFQAPVQLTRTTLEQIPLLLIAGGQPITIHAKSRFQVQEILADSPAIAGVDGGFFSLEYLDSNVMIGPVLAQNTKKFIPGSKWETPRLKGRPLVLISANAVRYIPFDPQRHNTLDGIKTEMPEVTDAFVAAAWLVKNSQPQSAETFGKLFDFNAERHRAFWGINQSGQPVVGVSVEPVGSVHLGELLTKADFRDAVMLDSGASTSLAYQGESLVGYTPRPVPHVVGLVSSLGSATACVAPPLKSALAR